MRLFLQLITVAAVAFAGSAAVGAVDWNTPLTLILGLATAALTILAYRWIVGRTEHRAVAELDLGDARRGLGRGSLLGLAMFTAVIANIALLGG